MGEIVDLFADALRDKANRDAEKTRMVSGLNFLCEYCQKNNWRMQVRGNRVDGECMSPECPGIMFVQWSVK